MKPVRWGIVGTGRMATTMAQEILALRSHGAILEAVASRHADSARTFSQTVGPVRSFTDIEAMAQDPQVDAIYIATPHTRHVEDMLAAIAAGKPTLCEKPFTINAQQATRVIDAAQRGQVFLMEAMWTRFLPALEAVRSIVASGAIGRVQMIVGGGAFMPDRNADHYLLKSSLGGGVLLDAGVYLLSLTSMLLGAPTGIQTAARIGETGVDEQDAIILTHAGGATALLYVSLHSRRAPDLEILGDAGRLRLGAPVFKPSRITVWDRDGVESLREFPIDGSGYGYQLREVNEAVRTGRRESQIMPLSETLSIMRTMDSIRQQIGLVYPGE